VREGARIQQLRHTLLATSMGRPRILLRSQALLDEAPNGCDRIGIKTFGLEKCRSWDQQVNPCGSAAVSSMMGLRRKESMSALILPFLGSLSKAISSPLLILEKEAAMACQTRLAMNFLRLMWKASPRFTKTSCLIDCLVGAVKSTQGAKTASMSSLSKHRLTNIVVSQAELKVIMATSPLARMRESQ
jgi:hypothetical protein